VGKGLVVGKKVRTTQMLIRTVARGLLKRRPPVLWTKQGGCQGGVSGKGEGSNDTGQQEDSSPEEESASSQDQEREGKSENETGEDSDGSEGESSSGGEESSGGEDESIGGEDESIGAEDESIGAEDESIGAEDESTSADDESDGEVGKLYADNSKWDWYSRYVEADPTVARLTNRNDVHFLPPKVRNVFPRKYDREYHRYLGP
jgi:hypothetical protein